MEGKTEAGQERWLQMWKECKNGRLGWTKRVTRRLSAGDGFRGIRGRFTDTTASLAARLQAKLACEKGQGTTEYAILVGVLVVIAILAITVFRPKLEELWQAIASGIQGL